MSNGLIRLSTKRNIYSTIFKTIQDLTTGKTKITSSGLFNGIFKGDFFKAQPIVSESDIAALENYNKLLANNKPQEAFEQAMKNTSQTAQNLAKNAKGAAVDINAIPKASKAAAAGMKLLSGVMNVGLSMAITYLISGIYKMAGAYDEMSQQAADATAKYKEQSSSIEDYKGKITELKTELASENLTYTEARDKRSQLLDIQKQLIDTYGAEAKGIDLVNGSLDDQVEKLDKLNKQKRQEWENEVNKQSAGQWWQKWGGYLGLALLDTVTFDWSFYDANKWLEDFDNTTNIERITKKVENFKKSINLNDLEIETEELEALKTQMDSYEGVSFKGNKMTIAGDAKTVAETVTKIQTEVIGSREDLQDLNQDLKDVYNSANKIVTANWDTYNQALENKILDDDKGFEYYGKLTEAYETYQKALKDGDKDAINKAKEDYASLLSDISNSDMDASFKKFFENMYPDISEIIEAWKFEVKIVPKITSNEDSLKDNINAVKDLTTDEIKAAFENNGASVSTDQWKAIANLNAEAQANGLDLTTFLEQLREAGYLVSQLDKDIEKAVDDTKNKYGDGVDWGKYFKDNSIDTQEEIDTWNEVTTGIDSAEEAMKAYAEAAKDAVDITQELKTFNEEVDEIQEAYSILKDAADEYNSTGHMSLDTVQKLLSLEPQYLAMLVNENGQLSLNEQAMRDLLTARLEETKAKIFENGINQINALTAEKTGAASEEAAGKKADAVSDIKEETKALNENTEANLRNVASKAIEGGASQEEVDAIVNATIAQATALESAVNGLSFDFGGTVTGKKTGGSDKNEALDNYLKDAENRYKIHQDETKYIQELQYAYDKLTKNEKERLDITGKINEAYRDLADNRIKDIEHQIDLEKELHGDDVDVTGYYDQIQKVAHEGADDYRSYAREQLGYDSKTDEEKAVIDEMIENTDEIQGFQKTWWDAENSKLDFYTKQHENIIRDLEHARDMELEKNPYADTTFYYKQMQAEYHKQAEYLRSLDPEKYKEEIQKLQQAWGNAQKEIADWSYSNSERWINERNTYNDWDLYGDNEVAAWERVLKRFQTEFPNELEKIKDIEQKIFDARKAAMEKSISDIEDYIAARNTYNDWDAYGDSEVKAIQRQTKIIEDEYKQRLISHDEYIDKLEEQSQRIYSLGQNQVDKHLSNIDKYIDARNHYNDWDDFNDSEIEAIKRQCAVLDEAYRLNLISLEEYTEKSAEYTKRLYSVAKENIIETISELVEDYEEVKQFESSQLESQKTLLQSYYDVTNAIAEAQHEINKELKASQSMYEYLNEETRELLFNQDDYNALNKELLDIQLAADELQKQYQQDILNANAETIAEITSQYQMQYETMMKQYEIAKAELEVAKKRQKLDNVLAERNTRMFINGQWQWVAKTQDVIDAQNELAEAENERKKREAELEQTESLNKFTEQINSLETDLNKVRKYWTDMQEMLNGESDEVAKALNEISQVSSPELKRVIEATGGSVNSFSISLSDSTDTINTIIDTNLVNMSTGINNIVTDLQNYADAIKALVSKINGVDNNTNNTNQGYNATATLPNGTVVGVNINSDWKTTTDLPEGSVVHTAGGDFKITGGSAGNYTSEPVNSSSKGSSSSGGSSSSSGNGSSSSSKQVNTTDQYVKSSSGNIQSNPNWDGKKKGGVGSFYKHADGTRYTPGGLTALGEEGFEAFINNNGRLIPIAQPTIGNIGAGGVVFNREQMANLRTLWDWSNLGKITPFVSSSNANNQNTVVDNSIHINGLTVGEQGNEDWINGLRRYVVTHK